MRKTLAGAGLAAIVLASCTPAPSTETFTGSLHYRMGTYGGTNDWLVEQGSLTGGASFSGKCMVPWIQNGSTPVPKDQGCFETLRVHDRVYRFTGKSTDLYSGTFKSVADKSTLIVTLVSWRGNGAIGVAELLVELRH